MDKIGATHQGLLDMAFFRSTVGYTDTEFDFLRYDNHNQKLNYGLKIYLEKRNMIKLPA